MATQYPYDASASLNGTTAITADGAGSVAYFDTESATARFPAVAVFNVTALDTTSGNETYDIIIQGCTATDFSSVQQLGSMVVSATGQYVIPFVNEQADTVYRYVRAYFDVAGTTPSITAQAFLAPAVLV